MQDMVFQYLYEADGLVYLLNSKTLEEISVPTRLIQSNLAKLLEGGTAVKVRMNGDRPVLVHPSVRNVKCTVAKVIDKTISIAPSPLKLLRGHTHTLILPLSLFHSSFVGSDRKVIVVETAGGAKITCSTLISEGDQILVNVDEMSYQGRAI